MKNDSDERVREKDTISVLYEDADMIVVYKPAGIMVHSDGRNAQATVVDWLLARAPTARGVGEPGNAFDGVPLERSGIVHRLDRDTSGVLILAKTQSAFLHLKAQFHDRQVRKEYRAFVYGTMREKWGIINRPIGRSAKDFRLRSAQRGARGVLRDATTEWELLAQSATHAYLALRPKTGRTHQIRVHLKAIGHPVVHDILYAVSAERARGDLGFERLALHAYSVSIVCPSGEKKEFVAPFPDDFETAVRSLAVE